MLFSKILIQWYQHHKRDLPWRHIKNPYPIWLSEIILQQTRVLQGLPYYLKFVDTFPTVFDLANAHEDDVLKLWQGLGYYSRARNLHQTAKTIAQDYNGVFPKNYIDLLKLKGVGTYTAAAIASFAYNEDVAVVDGNVYRVLARYFGLENDISLGETKKIFTDLATRLLPKNNSADFNQAIMEFGALQCVPKNPDCSICVFSNNCVALQTNNVSNLPIKSKKIVVKNRFFNYLIYIDKNNATLVQQRLSKDIWQHLYEFPLLETSLVIDDEEIINKINTDYNIKSVSKINALPIIHKLTHQKLHIQFWKINIEGVLHNAVAKNELHKLAFPVVIYNFLMLEKML